MKTNKILIGLLILFVGILWSCNKESSIHQSTTLISPPPGGNGNGNGNQPNEDPEPRYSFVFTGDVAYDLNGNYTIIDESGQSGTLNSGEEAYGVADKDGKKFGVLLSIFCPDIGYVPSSMYGMDVLNACFSDSECITLSVRQYDKRNDRQKVFAHIHYPDGRLSIRGYIQDQAAGSEEMFPDNPGEQTVIIFDRYKNQTNQGDPCGSDWIFFNGENANGNYDGYPILDPPVPDQSMIITLLDPNTGDLCTSVTPCI